MNLTSLAEKASKDIKAYRRAKGKRSAGMRNLDLKIKDIAQSIWDEILTVKLDNPHEQHTDPLLR